MWTPRPEAFPPAVRRAILRRDPVCRACGQRPSTEADHVIAWAEGGTHTVANGQGLCKPCHAAKTKAEAQRGYRRWQERRPRQRRPAEKHPGVLD